MKKKNYLVLLAAVVVGLLLLPEAVFASGNRQDGIKQITVMVESGSPGEQVAKATAAAFKAKTGYEVIVDPVPYTGLYDKMSAELKAGVAAHDVATLDVLWLPAFKDGLLPLNNMVNADIKADFLPTMLDGGSLDGTLYGMPMWINCKVLIYRSDLFGNANNKAAFKTKYGYDLVPPTTWRQYLDIAEFFHKDGMYGTAVYGMNSGDTVCTWLDFSSQAGARPLVLDTNNNVLIDQQPYIDALQFMCDQFTSGNVPEETLAVASTEAQEMFNNGKLAMQLNWSHQYPAAYAALPGKVAVAPMIGGKAGIAATTGPWYECILKNSSKQDIAKEYLLFMYEHNGDYMEAALKIAGRTSVYEVYASKPGNEHLKAVLDTLGQPQSQNRPATPLWTEMEEILAGAIQSAMSGKKTPKDALIEAKAEIQRLF
jgi:multiple sugar transport system substrate-binding protein